MFVGGRIDCFAKPARRQAIVRAEQGVEAADAGESARLGHLDDGKSRFGEKLLGEQESPRLGEFDG